MINRIDLNSKQWLLVAILSFIYTLLAINSSIYGGRLSLPSTYDDMAYLQDGLNRLDILYSEGFFRFIKDLWNNTPHAPFSTLAAAFAFATLGVRDSAPYFVNILCVAIIVSLPLFLIKDEMSLLEKFFLQLVLLSFPLTYHAVVEFRPDLFCGLIATLGIAILVRPLAKDMIDKKILFWSGVCMAVAIFSKPTVSPSIASGYFGASFILVYLAQKRNSSMPSIKNILLYLWMPSLLIVAVIFAKNIPHYIEYVGFAFGGKSSIWALPRQEMFLYYFFGHAGKAMFGRSIFLLLLILVISVLLIVRTKLVYSTNRIFVFLLITALGAFTPLFVVAHDNPFLGVFFQGIFIVGVFFTFTLVYPLFKKYVFGVVFLIFMLVSFFAFLFPLPNIESKFSDIHSRRIAIFNTILEEIRSEPNYKISFATTGQIINASSVQWELSKIGQKRAVWSDVYQDNSEFVINQIKNSDVIVTAEKGALDQYTEPFQYIKSIDIINKWLSENKGLYVSKMIDTGSGKYYIYRKNPSFENVDLTDGFGKFEGPFPQWELGKVIWSKGKTVMVSVDCSQGSSLNWSAKLNRGTSDVEIRIGQNNQIVKLTPEFLMFSTLVCSKSYGLKQIYISIQGDAADKILFSSLRFDK